MGEGETLVIGQGLAGTILSYQLHKRGISHRVIDNAHRSAATHAAAGIINPITGRRYVKSWMIDDLLPAAKSFYKDIEAFLSIDILRETSIIRSLADAGQENNWLSAIDRPAYSEFSEASCESGNFKEFVHPAISYGRILQALQVNVSLLIDSYRKWLQNNHLLIELNLEHHKVDWQSQPVTISGITFEKVIFCEGYKVVENPLFDARAFQPSKGESLEIEIPGLETNEILRDDIFLVPFGKNVFWTGGGYSWNYSDPFPTAAFKENWTKKLNKLLSRKFEIVKHQSGVRPSVIDRRPVIGQHPDLAHVYLFNGMGTKGSSLAPYWASELIKHIYRDEILNPLVSLERFIKS